MSIALRAVVAAIFTSLSVMASCLFFFGLTVGGFTLGFILGFFFGLVAVSIVYEVSK